MNDTAYFETRIKMHNVEIQKCSNIHIMNLKHLILREQFSCTYGNNVI